MRSPHTATASSPCLSTREKLEHSNRDTMQQKINKCIHLKNKIKWWEREQGASVGFLGVSTVPGKMAGAPVPPGPHPQAQPSIPDAQRQVSASLSGQVLPFSRATAWGRGNYSNFRINRLVLNLVPQSASSVALGKIHALWALYMLSEPFLHL